MRIIILLALCSTVSACALLGSIYEPESVKFAKSCVSRVIFLGEQHVLLANNFGQLYASDTNGKTWELAADDVFNVAVANRSQLWGCTGVAGFEDAPHAEMSRSVDRGRSWIRWELKMPKYGPEVLSHLPIAFVNEPQDGPLLLMQDLQLVVPRVNTDVEQWTRVGHRVPAVAVGTDWSAAGFQHAGVIYVATQNQLFMSTDLAQTWVAKEVHPFDQASIVCGETTCYALLSRIGSAWNGIVSTPLGRNDWAPFGTLELPAIRDALGEQSQRLGKVEYFGADQLIAFDGSVLVAGIANAGSHNHEWGAVLMASAGGQLRSLPGAAAGGLWELARDPKGRLWAGGVGAFLNNGRGWVRVWPGHTLAAPTAN